MTILEFAFFTLGVKVLLAIVVIYGLFPSDRSCPRCDAQTLLLTARRGFAWLGKVTRVRRRWCPSCGLQMLAREPRRAPVAPSPADRAREVSRR